MSRVIGVVVLFAVLTFPTSAIGEQTQTKTTERFQVKQHHKIGYNYQVCDNDGAYKLLYAKSWWTRTNSQRGVFDGRRLSGAVGNKCGGEYAEKRSASTYDPTFTGNNTATYHVSFNWPYVRVGGTAGIGTVGSWLKIKVRNLSNQEVMGNICTINYLTAGPSFCP